MVMTEKEAEFVADAGYSYGDVANYANFWDCTFQEALQKLYEGLKNETKKD